MKKIITSLMVALLFIGCSSDKEQIIAEPTLVIGKSLQNLTLNDQFEKPHAIEENTTKIIFAFSKDMAHICNDYFATQEDSYLAKNNTVFVADVSAAPSIIRNLFIMPGLKDFKHTVLLLDNKELAAPFRSGVETEKIVVVYINNQAITGMKSISTEAELKEIISN